MKIIQINCVYSKGSTGKITKDLHEGLLEKGVDSLVLYGRGYNSNDPRVKKICGELYARFNRVWSFVTGTMYGGCSFSTARIIRTIKKEKPDVVHLQCINGNFVNIYRLISWLKKNKIKTILTLHAEFMYTANCGYSFDCEKWKNGCGNCPRLKQETHSWLIDGTHRSWIKMRDAFDGFSTLQVVSCSNWIQTKSAQSPILAAFPNVVVHNGIDTNLFNYEKKPGDLNVLKKYGIPLDKKIVLHVTPGFFNEIKGGSFFRELSQILPGNYQCVVVGCSGSDAKGIVHIPYTQDQSELAAIYRSASVFVITSKRDNYPTVCLEANCCGIPVVGFNVGGVKETIYPSMGEVVNYGDIIALRNKTIYWSNVQPQEKTKNACLIENGKRRMIEDYLALYKKAL